ncbi:MAG: hypothetical protein JWO41_566 [Candidatus Saccharibacteria bacterium]|nr:hypothetical protein [Candidatus Saccharibacteria bacterium]
MTTAETFPQSTSHPSPTEKGVLYSDYILPDYDGNVDASSVVNLPVQPQGEYGIAYPQLLSMDDDTNTSYKVVRFEAANPRSDVWVVKDTAWGTQPEGLNTDVARKLMSMGFNVIIKGPEIGSSLPLSQSAFNTHKVLDYFSSLGYLSAKQIAVEGYSRGSMLAFGTNAYAEDFGRNVIYSNLTDPCNALPIRSDLETIKKGIRLPLDLGLLALAVGHTLTSPGRGKHLSKTADLSREGGKQFIRTGRPLMSGEAGMMAARTPLDMHATIAFFRLCGVNDAKTYRQILGDRPNVRFVRPDGGHGAGIDTKIIGNIALRFGRLADQLSEGRSAAELDYRHILHGLQLVKSS